ncbi:MAG TPA: hypothetical protein DCQ06_05325 [Myxococcales bacterium]|nr:hypothetical protein [Myxococcales bacterium]
MNTIEASLRNVTLLRDLVPYVVATPSNLPALDLTPFGVPAAQHIDPTKMASADFLDILHRLDGLTFGPEGMPMPKWVFFDCAEVPGAIYGLARPASTLWPAARELFAVPASYDGLVPLSMYIAIPMQRFGAWFGHNLASAAPALRDAGLEDVDLRGLGSVTKALGLKCFGVRDFYGATQWTSKALFIHVKFGPLNLSTAWTPAHSELETLTYGFEVTDGKLRASVGDRRVIIDRPQPTLWLDAHDPQQMQDLQARIEAGQAFCIPSAPKHEGGRIHVPVTKI